MTEDEAKAAVADVVKWLRLRDEQNINDTDLAREWSREMLEAARVDDMGGCPLCCS